MIHSYKRVWCPLHGEQITMSCVIACPKCEYAKVERQYQDLIEKAFKDEQGDRGPGTT